jgi:hypothetical protein
MFGGISDRVTEVMPIDGAAWRHPHRLQSTQVTCYAPFKISTNQP